MVVFVGSNGVVGLLKVFWIWVLLLWIWVSSWPVVVFNGGNGF